MSPVTVVGGGKESLLNFGLLPVGRHDILALCDNFLLPANCSIRVEAVIGGKNWKG